MALGRSDPEARRARMAVDSDQKPPIATPTSARPRRKTTKLGASATARLETASTAGVEKHDRLAIKPCQKEVAERARGHGEEAGHGDRLSGLAFGDPRSRAMGVSRLTGMNSSPTRRKLSRARQTTAPQGVAVLSVTVRSSSTSSIAIPDLQSHLADIQVAKCMLSDIGGIICMLL